MRRYELELEDFWNDNVYALTDGRVMTKVEFLRLQKQGKKVYVISDDANVFDLEFEVHRQ